MYIFTPLYVIMGGVRRIWPKPGLGKPRLRGCTIRAADACPVSGGSHLSKTVLVQRCASPHLSNTTLSNTTLV